MRGWLPWLLVFGVIAGLCGRVLALDHSHLPETASECCGHDHDPEPPDDGHGTDCPPGPHDHPAHACCHPAPITGEEIRHHRVSAPSYSRLGVSWWKAMAPDAPVFELDKPPLI